MAEQLAFSLTYAPAHVVCFSGGHSSAIVAVEVVRRYGRAGVVLLNHDLCERAEGADVKRFKREVADALGLPITYANHPRWSELDQFDVVETARAFKVRSGQELCTSRLKTEPFQRWLAEHAPPGTATIYYGFDASEEHRIRRRATILGAAGYATAFPLAHWPRTIESTRELGVEPPNAYARFKHANCVGCLKAGWQHWFVVFCTRPDVWERAKLAEERIGYSIHRDAYLHEREAEFAAMQRAGVEPTEHVPSAAFWADAKRAVRSLPLLAAEADERALPCECVFRRRGRERRPVCTCLALHCAAVLGDGVRRAA